MAFEKVNLTRRDFIKTSILATTAMAAAKINTAYSAGGSDKLRVGLIGCGGRGTGAAIDCVRSSQGIEIVAMGDVFRDQIDKSLATMSRAVDDKVSVTEETTFVGFDAYQKVLALDIDMVILAAPPHFRPMHFKAAVEAGKHVFMEKPVAVDPVGVRSIIESAKLAKEKKLGVVAGTQRRHQSHYLDVMKRVHDGEIGKIVAAECFWTMGLLWTLKRHPDWSDMEWQCRNWLYYTWLSGDQMVEQHVHNLDVVNWAIGTHPVSCMGLGGRQVRVQPEYGNVFDHFAVEYEYPNGVKVFSMCRQMAGCHEKISEQIIGTEGISYTDSTIGQIKGKKEYKYEGPNPNPYEIEHKDLIDSIRSGNVLNEGQSIAESTLTAIMGRMSAYTGRALSWDWVMNASKLDLSPPKYEFCELPEQPVAVPGKTALI